MAQTNLSAVEAAVIEYYSGGVEDITGNSSKTLKEVEVGKPEELNSRGASIVIQPQNNASERWGTSEFADFPTPGNSPLVKVTVPFVGVSATAQFSHHVLAEDANATTLANLVRIQLDNKAEALMQSRNIFLWGDGSGERARVSSVSGAGPYVVTCNNSGNLYGVQLLDVGAQVELRNGSGTLKSGGGVFYGTITAVNYGTPSFTIDTGPNDIANNDRVYLYGSYGSAPRGFLYQCANSGAWQGLSDRTIYKNTSSAIQNGSNAVLSAALMDKMTSGQAFKRGTRELGKIKYYVSAQWDAYLNIGYEMKVYQGKDKLDATFEMMSHGGVGFEWDPHVQRDSVHAIDVSYMKEYRMKKIGLVKNQAGGIFFQMNAANGQGHASGVNVYWEGFMNYGTKFPSALGTRLYSLSTANLDLGNNT